MATLPRLLLITDDSVSLTVARTVPQTLELALARVGPEDRVAVLVRRKERSTEKKLEQLERVLPLCRARGVKVFLHLGDDASLAFRAKQAGADGIHLSSKGDVASARMALGTLGVVGASRHAEDRLDAKDVGDASYITLSPVFRATSKPGDEREALGIDGLRAAAGRSSVPAFALGGITPSKVSEVLAAGAAGIAVLGAVMGSRDPGGKMRAFLDELARSPTLV